MIGGTKEVWDIGELAKGVHNGRYIDSVEERDGVSPQSQTCSTPGRHLFLVGEGRNYYFYFYYYGCCNR